MNTHENIPPGQNKPIDIVLDGNTVTAPRQRMNGREIRELGDANRVDGFETQLLLANGKKDKTIPDDEQIELHPGQRFRTVPNEGGPGACA